MTEETLETGQTPAHAKQLKLPPLQLGKHTIDTPVVLAPMAGVTNKAFRRLCRDYGGGLYVTEMVTARSLVERNPESLRIIDHDGDEKIRSIQIYGVDAVNVGKAIRMVVEEDRADHIDLNFGCPSPRSPSWAAAPPCPGRPTSLPLSSRPLCVRHPAGMCP